MSYRTNKQNIDVFQKVIFAKTVPDLKSHKELSEVRRAGEKTTVFKWPWPQKSCIILMFYDRNGHKKPWLKWWYLSWDLWFIVDILLQVSAGLPKKMEPLWGFEEPLGDWKNTNTLRWRITWTTAHLCWWWAVYSGFVVYICLYYIVLNGD